MIKPVHINAVDLPDAWFQCVSNILDYGFKYEIQQGSFVGQTRLEFDWVSVKIEFPYSEPYDTMLPQIPAHLNIPNPVDNGYIEQYLPYLMTGYKEEGEQYTYGSRIVYQIGHVIQLLKKTPMTNQAILQVAQPNDIKLSDPPCLRHIDMRIKAEWESVNGDFEELFPRLVFYPYFRSWDLWGGFPANLAGIAVLQKYMADEIGVESGPIVASSKGLHLYGYVEELARIRANK